MKGCTSTNKLVLQCPPLALQRYVFLVFNTLLLRLDIRLTCARQLEVVHTLTAHSSGHALLVPYCHALIHC